MYSSSLYVQWNIFLIRYSDYEVDKLKKTECFLKLYLISSMSVSKKKILCCTLHVFILSCNILEYLFINIITTSVFLCCLFIASMSIFLNWRRFALITINNYKYFFYYCCSSSAAVTCLFISGYMRS